MLVNLFYFTKLWDAFDAIDADDDRRLTFDEFLHGLGVVGLKLSATDARDTFDSMDVNGGGVVLFDGAVYCLSAPAMHGSLLFAEFCLWVAVTKTAKA